MQPITSSKFKEVYFLERVVVFFFKALHIQKHKKQRFSMSINEAITFKIRVMH